MQRSHLLLCTAAFLCATVWTGCDSDTTAPPASLAPAVPPVGSMAIDLSFFDGGNPEGAPFHPEAVSTRNHWLNAVVRVTLVNLMVADFLHEPVQVLAAALSADPVVRGDQFVWSFVWNGEGRDVTVELRARRDGDTVNWELAVDDPDGARPLDNFVWFSGSANEAADSGHWTFHDLVDDQTIAVARLDYALGDAEQRTLALQLIDGRHQDFGDSLTYRVDGDLVSITHYDASAESAADVTWNETDGTGSYQDHGGERSCWDENQDDAECQVLG